MLRKREEHLQQLFDEAGKKVKALSDSDKYPEAMESLVTEVAQRLVMLADKQVLLLLLSEEVLLEHRPKDKDVVKKAADAAVKRYKDMSGRTSEIEFKDSLSDESAGGVIGSTMQGRIKVDNTLGERLKILEQQMLPELREDLFGKNPNRKFYTVSCIALATS